MGRGKIGGGEEEIQNATYKISYKNVLYNTENIVSICMEYMDFVWNIIYENTELLCCTPETNTIFKSTIFQFLKKNCAQ